MSTAAVFKSIRAINEAYRKRIAAVTSEKFQQTPPDGGWCYAEVYAHIFDLSILSLDAVDRSLSPEAKQRSTPLITRLILFFGAFPPALKFKVPKQFESRVKKITIPEAETLIQAFEDKLQYYPQLVEQAPAHTKAAHPRLGYLNAAQWMRFIEIHLKHHLKQLNRIDKQDNFTSLRS